VKLALFPQPNVSPQVRSDPNSSVMSSVSRRNLTPLPPTPAPLQREFYLERTLVPLYCGTPAYAVLLLTSYSARSHPPLSYFIAPPVVASSVFFFFFIFPVQIASLSSPLSGNPEFSTVDLFFAADRRHPISLIILRWCVRSFLSCLARGFSNFYLALFALCESDDELRDNGCRLPDFRLSEKGAGGARLPLFAPIAMDLSPASSRGKSALGPPYSFYWTGGSLLPPRCLVGRFRRLTGDIRLLLLLPSSCEGFETLCSNLRPLFYPLSQSQKAPFLSFF